MGESTILRVHSVFLWGERSHAAKNMFLIEYRDYPGDTERVQLDDPTTHRFWKLLQTKQHLEPDPHPGFKDRDQFFIGYCALYNIQGKCRHGHGTALGPPRLDD